MRVEDLDAVLPGLPAGPPVAGEVDPLGLVAGQLVDGDAQRPGDGLGDRQRRLRPPDSYRRICRRSTPTFAARSAWDMSNSLRRWRMTSFISMCATSIAAESRVRRTLPARDEAVSVLASGYVSPHVVNPS